MTEGKSEDEQTQGLYPRLREGDRIGVIPASPSLSFPRRRESRPFRDLVNKPPAALFHPLDSPTYPCHHARMAHGPIFFTPELYEYYKSIGYREPVPLAALRLHFQDHPQAHQQTMPESAQLLSFLVALTRPQHILEIGTFIGYSTLAMALAMGPACRLTTCDTNADLATQARLFWEKSGKGSQITFASGPAQETLVQMIARHEVADFIYIDANKAGYDDYYEAALQLAPLNGVIVLDNTLCAGQVIHPHPPAYVHAIQQLNQKIHEDKRVEMLLLPLGDGVTLVRKIEE